MAVRYLRIRGLLRKGFRVDKTGGGGTLITSAGESIVDLNDPKVRQSLAHHKAIGAFVEVGPSVNATGAPTIVSGGVVTAGAGLSVNVSVSEIRPDGPGVTGAYVAGSAATNLAIGANASGNPRIDLVTHPEAGGAAAVTAGTPAVAPVAPATPAGKIPLATVAVANGAVAPGTITDVRPRP